MRHREVCAYLGMEFRSRCFAICRSTGRTPVRYCWRIQKVGKDTTKTVHFPFAVGNIDHLSCLEKVEHLYEGRIRQQYLNGVVLSLG